MSCYPGLSEDKAEYFADQWKSNIVALSRSALGQTLMVNQLVDIEWKFGGKKLHNLVSNDHLVYNIQSTHVLILTDLCLYNTNILTCIFCITSVWKSQTLFYCILHMFSFSNQSYEIHVRSYIYIQ